MKPQKNIIITVAPQQDQENVKDTRKTFKDLQRNASDKENLIGRSSTAKDIKVFSDSGKVDPKKKKLQMISKSTQTGQSYVTADDLISEEPSVDYWKKLAETRGQSLDDSLHEIEKLKDNVHALKEENKICKEMLDESKNLIEVLQEMLSESEGGESQDNNSSIEQETEV